MKSPFVFLKHGHETRIRKREIQTALRKYPKAIWMGTSRFTKEQLADRLRQIQVTRRFVRMCLVRKIGTRDVSPLVTMINEQCSNGETSGVTLTGKYRKNAAWRIQHWWRTTRRFVSNNSVDPITLEDFNKESGLTFLLVTAEGVVYRYLSDELFTFLHTQGSTNEPICRIPLTLIELKRLDRKVSPDLLMEYGPSVALKGERAFEIRKQRAVHHEISIFVEDQITGLINNMSELICRVHEGQEGIESFTTMLPGIQNLIIQLAVHDLEFCYEYISSKVKEFSVPWSHTCKHSELSKTVVVGLLSDVLGGLSRMKEATLLQNVQG